HGRKVEAAHRFRGWLRARCPSGTRALRADQVPPRGGPQQPQGAVDGQPRARRRCREGRRAQGDRDREGQREGARRQRRRRRPVARRCVNRWRVNRRPVSRWRDARRYRRRDRVDDRPGVPRRPAMTSSAEGRRRADTPDSPTDLTKPAWGYVVRKTVREFSDDQCTDLAAALTYYAVLALFPASIAILSLVGLF